MLSLSSNGTSTKPKKNPSLPASNVVLSRIRGFNTSLTFKRSAANPSPLASTTKLEIPGPRQRPPQPSSSITQVAIPRKSTFQWVKGELLGRGSYAQVFLALNATTGEIMAVKQVELPQTASDKSNSRQLDIMQALKLEQNTLKDLDHANIVQYLGYEESPRYLSIFLEYVPGGTISSCLKNHGKFDEGVTKSFTSQILVGLEYLHSRGILHRDLKADNILVETTGICKISDFGISKKTFNRTRAFTTMKGTLFWMAPEILESKGKGYDVKVDIWSVGCIVLEMWTGDRPWSGEEFFPVMFKLFQQKSPPPTPAGVNLSEDAIDFRRQCFQMDPENRPSAAELQQHPYLRLPVGWKFKLSDIEGSPHLHRSPSLASRKSRKSWKSIRHAKSSLADSHEIIPSV
ncbi:kinase-like domain-containing protein, partial [Collybia nuda]